MTRQIIKIIGSFRNRKYNHWNEESVCKLNSRLDRCSWEKIAELEKRALGIIQSVAQRVKELSRKHERQIEDVKDVRRSNICLIEISAGENGGRQFLKK